MAITIERTLNFPIDEVWGIVGDVQRVDWVPGVERCEFDGEVRRFTMSGAGHLAERIFEHDDNARRLVYGVVESTPPLEHHRACIQLSADGERTKFLWTTEVAPESVAPFIRKGMQGSLDMLERVLSA